MDLGINFLNARAPAKFNRRLIYTRICRDSIMTYDDCFIFLKGEIQRNETKGKERKWNKRGTRIWVKALQKLGSSAPRGYALTILSDSSEEKKNKKQHKGKKETKRSKLWAFLLEKWFY